MRLSLVLTGVLVGSAVFIGCGSSSTPTGGNLPVLRTGVLIDSPIAGVGYSCGDITGKTTAAGKFSCRVVPVTFKIGKLTLGSINAFTADNKVYPQDLVGVARTNFTDTKLVGLTRFLQSLDDDGNISRTINIPEGMAEKFSAGTLPSDWAGLAEVAGVSLVSEELAMEHLKVNFTGNGGNSNNGTWVPVTNNFTCDPAAQTFAGMRMDSRYAAEGDISVACVHQEGYTFPQYRLGVEALEITQMVRVEQMTGTSSAGTFSGTTTHDFQAGTVHIVETFGSSRIDCVETYTSLLPKTLSNVSDLEDLMEFNPARSMLTHTTCPMAYYEEGDDGGDDHMVHGSGTERVNYTLTDSAGKVHKIATEVLSSK